jgi:hypothetical protein
MRRVLSKLRSPVCFAKWLGCAGLAISLPLGVALGAGSKAGAATSSTPFCRDSAQLQSWFLQNYEPGIAQYQNPGVGNVKSEARYLQKLTEEAPPAIQPELFVWATFTTQVADGASYADLSKEELSASADAAQVQEWFATESGCAQLDKPIPAHSSTNHLWWIIGGVLLGLVLLGAAFGRSDATTTSPSGRGSARTDSADRSYGFAPKGSGFGPKKVTCPTCGGRGWRPCPNCIGTGYLGTGPDRRPCPYSNCNYGRTTCSNCWGSGDVSA